MTCPICGKQIVAPPDVPNQPCDDCKGQAAYDAALATSMGHDDDCRCKACRIATS